MDDWRHIMARDRGGVMATRYLGDGVYAAYDGYGIWLTAEDGITASDAIYFEPAVCDALFQFIASLSAANAARATKAE